MKLLTYCPNCDKIFQSKLIGEMSPSATVSNCQESCPMCGNMAQTSDYISKIMYIADEAFHTTSDAETLRHLLQILQDGQRQKQDLSEIADNIQALGYKFDNLAECVRQGKKQNKVEMAWAAIKYIISLLLSMLGN